MMSKKSGVKHISAVLLKESAKAVTATFKAISSLFSHRLNNPKKIKSPAIFRPFQVIKIVKGEYAQAEKRNLNDSIIMLVFGKRGSGKSALGFKIIENIHARTNRPCYVLGINEDMPEWITPIENISKAPNGSVILVDEGAVSFSSRESMRLSNRELTKILAIARHKNLTLVFITQNTGLIDKTVLKLADVLIVKEGSLLQEQMERPEIRSFYERSKEHFDKIKGDRRPYSYIIDSEFEGFVRVPLPSFWSEKLSKNRADEKNL